MREGPGSSPSIRREPDRSLLRAIPSTDLAVLNKAGLLEYPIAFESENEENDPAPQFPMRDRFPPAVSVRTRCHGEERES
ncbi:hypothetical protein [Methanosphaerula palustris]|uniref:hypothetical protein n=1 Tax=Methanosphaerula palustris TaxID=475088 RepID=UPI0011D16798|nr:hypothetical protein [Methanosphaerula palustris]